MDTITSVSPDTDYPATESTRTWFFNNCHRRPHERIYGDDAFYDLSLKGPQADKATTLRVGDTCIVATPDESGDTITFTSFGFVHDTIRHDETRMPQRVLFGTKIISVTISKKEAAKGMYSAFFDKNGHFKQQSVIRR